MNPSLNNDTVAECQMSKTWHSRFHLPKWIGLEQKTLPEDQKIADDKWQAYLESNYGGRKTRRRQVADTGSKSNKLSYPSLDSISNYFIILQSFSFELNLRDDVSSQ